MPPISTTNGVPPGSDGHLPTTDSSGLGNTPTPNQFVTFESFGGATAATNQALLKNNAYLTGASNFNGTVAQQMQLPVGGDSSGVLFVLRRASVGAPYVNQAIQLFLRQYHSTAK